MIRYCATIFLSAFLLFQVQPMIARFILPWFGGTAAVWTTCMMFFQIALLLGYLYSHLLRRLFSPRNAWLVHVMLLGVATVMTSVSPPEALKPSGNENVTLAIIHVLTVTIGLPFFALSSTGPLIQAWQASSHAGQSPYRLYALSNLGSMLALVTYPFLVERLFPLAQQATLWTIGFGLFALGSCWSGWQTIGLHSWSTTDDEPGTEGAPGDLPTLGIGQTLLWILLAMSASIVLLATTNLMCQEVASIPFLWILPLTLYLLSFIICFDRPKWYQRRLFVPLLIISTFVAIALVHLNVFAGLLLQVAGLATVCFAASMVCHGELERLKPVAAKLTSFYLWIAVGGALGGVFVCVVAPNCFTGFYEFHVGLLICLLIALGTIIQFGRRQTQTGGRTSAAWLMAIGIFVAVSFVLCSLWYFLDPSYHPGLVFRGRNEYGLAAVIDRHQYRRFINGRIEHGGQSLEPGHELDHIRYYVPGTGVGVAFNSYREQTDSPLNVGVIGLGAGAMATWLEPGDKIVFYEINPMVEEIANEHFGFLKGSAGSAEVRLGDGRMQLQKQLNETGPMKFDLLFMDAFSSDSIPVHLLTTECFELYVRHLKSDGILIAHITNRFIDLRPVIKQHAIDHRLTPILVDYQSADKTVETTWVLLTRNKHVIQSSAAESNQIPWPETIKPVRWTDDYASVAALLNWKAEIDWKKISQLRDANQQLEKPKTD